MTGLTHAIEKFGFVLSSQGCSLQVILFCGSPLSMLSWIPAQKTSLRSSGAADREPVGELHVPNPPEGSDRELLSGRMCKKITMVVVGYRARELSRRTGAIGVVSCKHLTGKGIFHVELRYFQEIDSQSRRFTFRPPHLPNSCRKSHLDRIESD